MAQSGGIGGITGLGMVFRKVQPSARLLGAA